IAGISSLSRFLLAWDSGGWAACLLLHPVDNLLLQDVLAARLVYTLFVDTQQSKADGRPVANSLFKCQRRK
ncbi:MAG: hypothetical protein WAU10_20940, partial [Caldilineaceae bacterium]